MILFHNNNMSHKTFLSRNTCFLTLCYFLFFITALNAQHKSKERDHAATIIKELHALNSKKVFVIAHRGDWRTTTENSIECIQGAIDKDVDVVEIDIQKTKDGQLILMHDETLDRTTTGTGYVKDWTLDSLKTLNLRNGLGRPTIFKIPTLEEAMLTAKGKILVNLDKCYDHFADAYTILEKTGTTYQVIMKGNKPVAQVKQDMAPYLSKIIYMPIINLAKADAQKTITDFQHELKPVAIEFIFDKDTAPGITQFPEIQKQGTRIWINSLWPSLNGGHDDDRALTDLQGSYQWLLEKGATLIQTDRPELLLNYLGKMKRR